MDTQAQQAQQVIAIRNLTKELPINDFGLPIGIYRLDMLPWYDYITPDMLALPAPGAEHIIEAPAPDVLELSDAILGNRHPEEFDVDVELDVPTEISHEHDDQSIRSPQVQQVHSQPQRIAGFIANGLEGAFVWLSYDEGFPSFSNGIPFWSQMDFEPLESYSVFQRYLQMHQGREGKEEEIGTPASGIRALATLVTDMHGDEDLLDKLDTYTNYFHMYYWGLRAKAYDIFRVAQHRKQQEMRAIETEDSHYVTARKLMHKVLDYFDDEEDFWDMLSPKVAIDFFKTLASMERISAGLPGGGPAIATDGAPSSAQSLELAFRTIAQETNQSIEKQDGDITVLQDALKSPEDTAVLQELIIRISGGT